MNSDKTKVMVFKNGNNISRRERWWYNGQSIEVVKGFSYVGVLFTNRLSLYKMAEHNAIKAKRVFIHLQKMMTKLLPCSKNTFFKIFYSKILPMLQYGSELWGLTSMTCIENVHLYACKCFMNVPIRACNAVVKGDCGRHKMFIFTAKRVVKYWLRILKIPDHRYLKKCYFMLRFYDNLGYNSWVSKLRFHLYSV